MTNKEFYEKYKARKVLYKGKDIGAYVAGYVEEKYLILGFFSSVGCILQLSAFIDLDRKTPYRSYRFAKMKYVTLENED